jgi:hypothetical protein
MTPMARMKRKISVKSASSVNIRDSRQNNKTPAFRNPGFCYFKRYYFSVIPTQEESAANRAQKSGLADN